MAPSKGKKGSKDETGGDAAVPVHQWPIEDLPAPVPPRFDEEAVANEPWGADGGEHHGKGGGAGGKSKGKDKGGKGGHDGAAAGQDIPSVLFEDPAGLVVLPPALQAACAEWKRPHELWPVAERATDAEGAPVPISVVAPWRLHADTVPRDEIEHWSSMSTAERLLAYQRTNFHVKADPAGAFRHIVAAFDLLAAHHVLLGGDYLWHLISPKAPAQDAAEDLEDLEQMRAAAHDPRLAALLGQADPQYNASGKYIVKVFLHGAWRSLVVDDRIPCDADGTALLPMSTQQGQYELWPLLLTKAVCKLANDGHAADAASNDLSYAHWLSGLYPLAARLPAADGAWADIQRAMNESLRAELRPSRKKTTRKSQHHHDGANEGGDAGEQGGSLNLTQMVAAGKMPEGNATGARLSLQQTRNLVGGSHREAIVALAERTHVSDAVRAEMEALGLHGGHLFGVEACLTLDDGTRLLRLSSPYAKWRGKYSDHDAASWVHDFEVQIGELRQDRLGDATPTDFYIALEDALRLLGRLVVLQSNEAYSFVSTIETHWDDLAHAFEPKPLHILCINADRDETLSLCLTSDTPLLARGKLPDPTDDAASNANGAADGEGDDDDAHNDITLKKKTAEEEEDGASSVQDADADPAAQASPAEGPTTVLQFVPYAPLDAAVTTLPVLRMAASHVSAAQLRIPRGTHRIAVVAESRRGFSLQIASPNITGFVTDEDDAALLASVGEGAEALQGDGGAASKDGKKDQGKGGKDKKAAATPVKGKKGGAKGGAAAAADADESPRDEITGDTEEERREARRKLVEDKVRSLRAVVISGAAAAKAQTDAEESSGASPRPTPTASAQPSPATTPRGAGKPAAKPPGSAKGGKASAKGYKGKDAGKGENAAAAAEEARREEMRASFPGWLAPEELHARREELAQLERQLLKLSGASDEVVNPRTIQVAPESTVLVQRYGYDHRILKADLPEPLAANSYVQCAKYTLKVKDLAPAAPPTRKSSSAANSEQARNDLVEDPQQQPQQEGPENDDDEEGQQQQQEEEDDDDAGDNADHDDEAASSAGSAASGSGSVAEAPVASFSFRLTVQPAEARPFAAVHVVDRDTGRVCKGFGHLVPAVALPANKLGYSVSVDMRAPREFAKVSWQVDMFVDRRGAVESLHPLQPAESITNLEGTYVPNEHRELFRYTVGLPEPTNAAVEVVATLPAPPPVLTPEEQAAAEAAAQAKAEEEAAAAVAAAAKAEEEAKHLSAKKGGKKSGGSKSPRGGGAKDKDAEETEAEQDPMAGYPRLPAYVRLQLLDGDKLVWEQHGRGRIFLPAVEMEPSEGGDGASKDAGGKGGKKDAGKGGKKDGGKGGKKDSAKGRQSPRPGSDKGGDGNAAAGEGSESSVHKYILVGLLDLDQWARMGETVPVAEQVQRTTFTVRCISAQPMDLEPDTARADHIEQIKQTWDEASAKPGERGALARSTRNEYLVSIGKEPLEDLGGGGGGKGDKGGKKDAKKDSKKDSGKKGGKDGKKGAKDEEPAEPAIPIEKMDPVVVPASSRAEEQLLSVEQLAALGEQRQADLDAFQQAQADTLTARAAAKEQLPTVVQRLVEDEVSWRKERRARYEQVWAAREEYRRKLEEAAAAEAARIREEEEARLAAEKAAGKAAGKGGKKK